MFEADIGLQNVKLLYFIERHDFITSPQLARMRDTTERGARYLLNKLASFKYLDKIRIKSEQTRSYPYQYFITKKAKSLICETYDLHDGSKLIVRRNDEHKQVSTNFLLHNMGVNDFFSRLIAQSRALEIPGVILWATSRECCMNIHVMDDKIRPDGYGIIQCHDKHVHFVLEYDRGSSRYQRDLAYKFLKYLKYAESEMYINHFSIPRLKLDFANLPYILFLTVSEGRAKNMKEYFEFVAEREQMKEIMNNNYFLFSWEEKELMKNTLGDIWFRAGYSNGFNSMLR